MKSILFTIAILALGLWAYSFYFFATILAISFLIFFHELGHFLAARTLGVAVNTFSVGFGKKIFVRRVNGTDYAISAIPLGGYVQLKGQDDANPAERNYDKDSYNTLSPLGRIYILFAGPFFNIVLAFLIYIVLGFIGVEKLSPTIGYIAPNSAAFEAGLIKNDKILSINDKKISEWDEISKNVTTAKTTLLIERNNKILNISLTPKIGQARTIFGEYIQKPLIGISASGDIVKIYHNGFSAIPYAFNETLQASKLIFQSLSKLITGVVPLKEVGGIVQMSDITSKAAKISLSVLLVIVALLSVNLGILNLLPIPALDGGHITFNLYELITRKEVSQRAFVALTYCGWALLGALMVLATYNDIIRLTGGYK